MDTASDTQWEQLPSADAVASLLGAAAASSAERVAACSQMSFMRPCTGCAPSTSVPTQPTPRAHATPPAPTPTISSSSAGNGAATRPPGGTDRSLEAVVDAMVASGSGSSAAPASDVNDVVNGTALRKRGRPQGSKNKPYEGPPRKRKGRSHDDDWNQGHHSLQPNVKMVCLAGINKKTGAASKGCGMVLPEGSVRWVTADNVKHVPDGVPCAVIWTHGGGCAGGGAFRPARLRADYAGADASGDISAWVAIDKQEEQPHVGQTAGYRLHDGTDFNRDINGEYKRRGKDRRSLGEVPLEEAATDMEATALLQSATEAAAQSGAQAQRVRLSAHATQTTALPPPPAASSAAAAAAAAAAAPAPAAIAPPPAPYSAHFHAPYPAPYPAVAPAVTAVPLESVVPFPESQLPPPPHFHMSTRFLPGGEPSYTPGFDASLSQARRGASSRGPPAVLPAPSALAAAAAAMAPAILPTGRALHTACSESQGRGGYRTAAAPASSAYAPWAEGDLDAAELLVRAADLHALTEGYPEPETLHAGTITPGRYSNDYI